MDAAPGFTGDTSLFQFFGYLGLFCVTVLILRVIAAILRDGLNERGLSGKRAPG